MGRIDGRRACMCERVFTKVREENRRLLSDPTGRIFICSLGGQLEFKNYNGESQPAGGHSP